jgi:hypothetical protein
MSGCFPISTRGVCPIRFDVLRGLVPTFEEGGDDVGW